MSLNDQNDLLYWLSMLVQDSQDRFRIPLWSIPDQPLEQAEALVQTLSKGIPTYQQIFYYDDAAQTLWACLLHMLAVCIDDMFAFEASETCSWCATPNFCFNIGVLQLCMTFHHERNVSWRRCTFFILWASCMCFRTEIQLVAYFAEQQQCSYGYILCFSCWYWNGSCIMVKPEPHHSCCHHQVLSFSY